MVVLKNSWCSGVAWGFEGPNCEWCREWGACNRRLCQGSKWPLTLCYSTGSGKSVRSMKRKKKGKNFGKKTEMDMLVCKWGKSRYESWCETCFRFSRLGLTTQELHACSVKLALPFNTSSALKQVGYVWVTQVTGFLKQLMLQFCEFFNSTVSFLVGLYHRRWCSSQMDHYPS